MNLKSPIFRWDIGSRDENCVNIGFKRNGSLKVVATLYGEDATDYYNWMQSHAQLVEALKAGAQVNLPDFLDWLAERLVNVYGENPNIDFVQTCRERAKLCRAALAACGEDDTIVSTQSGYDMRGDIIDL